LPDTLYEGPPDARQAPDPNLPTSRFRPKYRQLSPIEEQIHDAIKAKAEDLEATFTRALIAQELRSVSAGREIALALTKLEESVMWAVKGLTK
jgi:hypothetical protein